MVEAQTPDQRKQFLTAEADQCVKCGLCLPACPTYQLSLNEAESPRGRIALIEGLASGRLQADAQFDRHLDSCLLCRRCEKVCPSQVRFGTLLDTARTFTVQHRPGWLKLLNYLLTSHKRLNLALRAANLFKRLPSLPGTSGRLQNTAKSIKPSGMQFNSRYPASAAIGQVGLFLGCIARESSPASLTSAVKLLNHAGYDVIIPQQQSCCGALHTHTGQTTQGREFSENNIRIFEQADVSTVISVATGCGTQIADYEMNIPHQDINAFLAQAGGLKPEDFKPLDAHVAVHIPCSQLNVLGTDHSVFELLQLIPKLKISALADNDRCCGAAGSYFLTHPQIAGQLRSAKIDNIETAPTEYLVTSNAGCALFLTQGLKGTKPIIIHPVELLAQQLHQ